MCVPQTLPTENVMTPAHSDETSISDDPLGETPISHISDRRESLAESLERVAWDDSEIFTDGEGSAHVKVEIAEDDFSVQDMLDSTNEILIKAETIDEFKHHNNFLETEIKSRRPANSGDFR